MVPSGVSSPVENPLHIPYAFPPNLFKLQDSPSPSIRQSHKIVESGRNYTKIPLSSGEEKYVDTFMVMNTTWNETRTKYSKEVSNEDLNF